MYNKSLDTFKAVADNGSFSKAASQLYLTHTAVIKQINALESQLAVKLFNRTNHGTTLTKAGQVLFTESLEIMKFSEVSIARVQEAHFTSPTVLHIGTSTLYPCQVFMNIWDKMNTHYPQFELQIVSFEDDAHRLRLLNKSFDFLVGPYNSQIKNKGYHFISIGSYKFCLSLHKNHSLSKRKSLSFRDLSNEKLMIMKPGYSAINDQIRQEILKNYPQIEIIDINPSYDVSTFNYCAESQAILLSLECWKDIHPALTTIPLEEEYYLPYGIVTSKHLSDTMQEFITIVENVMHTI